MPHVAPAGSHIRDSAADCPACGGQESTADPASLAGPVLLLAVKSPSGLSEELATPVTWRAGSSTRLNWHGFTEATETALILYQVRGAGPESSERRRQRGQETEV